MRISDWSSDVCLAPARSSSPVNAHTQETPKPGTVELHRVLRAPAERVYRAFLDADAKVKWLPPNGFTARVEHLDAKVGVTYRVSFTNFSSGHSHSFGGTYVELVPNRRIRYKARFDDPSPPCELYLTLPLKTVSCVNVLPVLQEAPSQA